MASHVFLLTGVGPRRAVADRVSHVLAVFRKTGDDSMVVLPFPDDFSAVLDDHGVHNCVNHVDIDGRRHAHVCVFVPFLPRMYDRYVKERRGFGFEVACQAEEGAFDAVARELQRMQVRKEGA